MATIRQRGKSWEVQIRRAGQPAVSATFARRLDAQAWARQVETKLDTTAYPGEANAVTMAAALDRYDREITKKRRGDNSRLDGYMTRALARSSLAAKPLGAIRRADIAYLVAEMQSRGLGPARIRRYLAVLSHVFTVAARDWAGMEELGNPVLKAAKPRPPAGRNRRLQPGEQERLLAGARPVMRAAIVFALETAARQGEIAALRWRDIDFERRTALFVQTKAGEPRTIPLSPGAIDALKDLRGGQQETTCVFAERAAMGAAFRRLCRRAGIAGLHFHDLRHEATSRLFERGLGIQEVAAVTGHKTWAMLKRYTHPRAEDIAKKLGAL